MSIIKKISKEIEEKAEKKGIPLSNFVLLKSNRKDLGDYQINDCMPLAKVLHQSPVLIANTLKEELEQLDLFENINIAGPGFINLTLKEEALISLLNPYLDDLYQNIDVEEKKKIILDFGGANVAKALHVGHLRSANLGEALKRLAKLLGHDVLGDAHLGDYGRPLGFVVLEIKKRYPDLPYFDTSYQGDYQEVELPITNQDLEEIYPFASTKAKEDEAYLEEARDVTVRIQAHERGYYDLWKKVVEISKADIKTVYDALNVSFELWQGESDAVLYFDELKQIFEEKGLLEESDGAKVVSVSKEEDKAPMPPLLFLRSNGSLSYETTDLATILERKKNYDPDEIWYCVDGRQELHFEQVFRASRKAKLVDDDVKLTFIGFGTMNGKDGKPFKTRDGGVMTLKALIDLVYKETLQKINKDTVSEEEKESIAMKVAIAALKYADFIPYRATDYIFDVEKFADLEGKTGPYLLYSTIRMKSLLAKAEIKQPHFKKFLDEKDRNVAMLTLDLAGVLTRSLEAKSLHEIADYLYQLTSAYNTFYQEHHILTETNKDYQETWLALTKLVYQINTLLLTVLGMEIPEKM